MHHVYYLLDANSLELLYIGRSVNPEGRRRAFANRHKVDVVLGVCQRFSNLEPACRAELAAIEKHWPRYNKRLISAAGFLGHSHSSKARSRTDAFRRRMSQVQLGKTIPESQRKLLSAALKGKPKSEATKQRMREAWASRKQGAA